MECKSFMSHAVYLERSVRNQISILTRQSILETMRKLALHVRSTGEIGKKMRGKLVWVICSTKSPPQELAD